MRKAIELRYLTVSSPYGTSTTPKLQYRENTVSDKGGIVVEGKWEKVEEVSIPIQYMEEGKYDREGNKLEP